MEYTSTPTASSSTSICLCKCISYDISIFPNMQVSCIENATTQKGKRNTFADISHYISSRKNQLTHIENATSYKTPCCTGITQRAISTPLFRRFRLPCSASDAATDGCQSEAIFRG